jgi:undecaprenyl-diphosphatase
VLIYFRATFARFVSDGLRSVVARKWDLTENSQLAWLLVIGTIPAGIIGLLIEDVVEDTLRDPALVAVMLIVFCLPLVLAERFGRQSRGIEAARPLDALLLGLAQSIALIPGVSRSGITISTGMFLGFRREQAAVFTFLLSAPIIAAAGGKQLFDIARGEGQFNSTDNAAAIYGAGLVTAAIVGYVAIAFLVRFLRGNPLHVFIAYRIVLGATILALVAANVL